MASKYYCSTATGELEVWSEKLHKLSREIERISSIDKYKLQPQIDALHIIITELDDRLCELADSCKSVERLDEIEAGRHEESSVNFSQSGKERFDYDFGG